MTSATPQGEVDKRYQESGQSTNTGLDENVAAAISYVLGWLTGIVMYIVESDSESVRFHAAQSIVVFGGYTVLLLGIGVIQSIIAGLAYAGGVGGGLVFGFVSTIIGFISLVLWLAGIVIWLYLLIRTYQGEDPRIPGAVGMARRIA